MELVEVDFYGDLLLARRGHAADDIDVVVRRICDHLGCDLATQLAKLKKAAWANCRAIPMVAADGKERLVTVLPLRAVPMWLAGIDVDRVGSNVREKLVRYQLECADVLARHFVRPRAPEVDPLAALRDPGQLRGLLLGYTERVLELEATVAVKDERIDELEKLAADADERFEEVKGAVELHARIEKANGMFGFREAARSLGIRSGQFVAFLIDEGYCYRLGKRKRLAAIERYLHLAKPLFHEAISEQTNDEGESTTWRRTWITPVGLERFAREYPAYAAKPKSPQGAAA